MHNDLDIGFDTERIVALAGGVKSSNHTTEELVRNLFLATARNLFEYPLSDIEPQDWVVGEVLENVSEEEARKPSTGFAVSYNLIDYFKKVFLETFDVEAFVDQLMQDNNVQEYLEKVKEYSSILETYIKLEEEISTIEQAKQLLEQSAISTPEEVSTKLDFLIEAYTAAKSKLVSLCDYFDQWQEEE